MTTQALHTKQINLSPFTKDFRVWGAFIENSNIYLRLSVDSYLNNVTISCKSLPLLTATYYSGHSISFSLSMSQTKLIK